MARKLAAGNWKMNGTGASLSELQSLASSALPDGVDVLICPPATLVARATDIAGPVAIGGQDCHAHASGAHTGDTSADMLKDAGATYVILGHSERRSDHGETDATVRAKTEAALAAGLIAVVCIGETLDEREAGLTLKIVGDQLAASLPDTATGATVVVAYEPVWAIGTGKVANLEQIGEVHDFLRAQLTDRFGAEGENVSLLYGGSVKPANAGEIFGVANVDGALVGGASLKAADFSPIIAALAVS
ncbi:Triosephosphate isomerase [Tritonibacter multivorans]|uniref:Triosephosphate isomerase n=1 Tax=Tritonibacter multivorans TaxID=928856 RepID=A0A0P1GXL3_9RHOB|nr:triose-phosphate isomerase [Tritonibacter multivorans]MDA7420891.1 triose-phosphate isomerase [Tritonibacter multivorans]CUH80555.1 Triosephosphate isomerase [Tritonibacter multivorans]SFC83133.1 triosephosphate isomerase [Tritonibacter multivorans]